MTINQYFDAVICINLGRRIDRWVYALEECAKHGLIIERFDAIDMPTDENTGCTASHAAVLRLIIERGLSRALVLEDDFMFRFDDTQERFAAMIGQVPDAWKMLYLGGHYAERPKRRVSRNVIEMNRMKTTSSYGVTLEAAKEMEPVIRGIGPIDELYGALHEKGGCYIFDPRLCVQREGFSDLQQSVQAYEGCMTDERHSQMV